MYKGDVTRAADIFLRRSRSICLCVCVCVCVCVFVCVYWYQHKHHTIWHHEEASPFGAQKKTGNATILLQKIIPKNGAHPLVARDKDERLFFQLFYEAKKQNCAYPLAVRANEEREELFVV